MNILITGCAGFIGFHLCNHILRHNKKIKIFGLDNMNKYYDLKLKQDRLKILKYYSNFKFYKTDLKNKKQLNVIFKNNKFYVVVNLAAQAGVRYSLTNPNTYIENNITGFLNLLEECKNKNIKHLLFASTSSVYGSNKEFPFSESQKTERPIQLYAVTKKTNELMAHAYSDLYKIPSTGLRFFTVYGTWGRPDMSLFIFTKNILLGRKISVFNHGNHTRDFTYVEDLVKSIEKLIKIPPKKYFDKSKGPPFRIVNIGSDNPVRLMRFIKLIEKYTKKNAKINFKKLQKGDVIKTNSDTSYLKKIIKFKPETPVEIGIKNFVNWFRDYYQL